MLNDRINEANRLAKAGMDPMEAAVEVGLDVDYRCKGFGERVGVKIGGKNHAVTPSGFIPIPAAPAGTSRDYALFVYVPKAIRLAFGLPDFIPAWRAEKQFGVRVTSVDNPLDLVKTSKGDWSPLQWAFDAVETLAGRIDAAGWGWYPECIVEAFREIGWRDPDSAQAFARGYVPPPVEESSGSILGDLGFLDE